MANTAMDPAPNSTSDITIPDAPAVPPGAWLCPENGPYPPGAPLITAEPEEGSPWAYSEDEIVLLWTQILKIFLRLSYVKENNVVFPPADTGRHAGMNTAYMRDELRMSERVISLVERLPYAFEYKGTQYNYPVQVYPQAVTCDYLVRDPRVLAGTREAHPAFSHWEEGRASDARLRPDDVLLLDPWELDGITWILDTKANTRREFWDTCEYTARKIPADFVDEVPEMEDHYRNWPAFHAPFVLKTYVRDLWDLNYLPQTGHHIGDTTLVRTDTRPRLWRDVSDLWSLTGLGRPLHFADSFLVARRLREDYGWPDAFRDEAWKRDRNRVERAAGDLKKEVTGGRGGFQDDIIKRWRAHPEEIPELVVPESTADS